MHYKHACRYWTVFIGCQSLNVSNYFRQTIVQSTCWHVSHHFLHTEIVTFPKLTFDVTSLSINKRCENGSFSKRTMAYITQGNKRGEVLVYAGFRYQKNRTTRTVVHWRCWRKECRAPLTTSLIGDRNNVNVLQVRFVEPCKLNEKEIIRSFLSEPESQAKLFLSAGWRARLCFQLFF